MKIVPGGKMRKKAADIEKTYSPADFATKLRRLADALEQDRRFTISIAGKRISVPSRAICSVEYEREGKKEEVEFSIQWTSQT
jgi:amphi-Trp domain-containing protein